jgi:hypothetical protein
MQIDSNLFQAIGFAVMFLFFIVIAWLLAEFKGMKDEIKERLGINNETIKLKLQAYERLTLLAERIGLKNMASRVSADGLTVVGLQATMIDTINSEYDYNTAQQIYVSADVWKAITKLKEQNIYIINQIASILPPQANGIELSRSLLEYTMNENAELNVIILNALRKEAKKIMV